MQRSSTFIGWGVIDLEADIQDRSGPDIPAHQNRFAAHHSLEIFNDHIQKFTLAVTAGLPHHYAAKILRLHVINLQFD